MCAALNITQKTESTHPAASEHNTVELPVLKDRHLLPVHTELIPDQLLDTLTSTCHTHTKANGVRRPDPVWNHPHGRKKYQHFLDQPPSLTGAGRDISFLCDSMVTSRRRMTLPPLSSRSSDNLKDVGVADTLIPEEYHIVKNRGVQGLEFYNDKFTMQLKDEEQRLRLFPSLRPSGRLEAVQLMRVMDDMLEKAGANQSPEELTHLSQMQNLLELVRVEQNIYNIVFHELIRQVSVECAERGHLLAKLRQRYVSLLDHIPRQLKGLHTETLAQRALDRRMTEEIICFKTNIQEINTELSAVRDHDEFVSTQAEKTQRELARALDQCQKNSDVVHEYHELYELQRRRLEGQVVRLTQERDLWSTVTYNLAVKVISVNKLQLASRLHVSEQTWSTTAQHLTLSLTAKDTEDLSSMVRLTEQWKEHVSSFMHRLSHTEEEQREQLTSIHHGLASWLSFCHTHNKRPGVKHEKSSVEELYADFKHWSHTLNQQCERYGGEALLWFQERLDAMGTLQESWVEAGLRVFRRHPSPDGEPPAGQEAMRELSRAVGQLHRQLGVRVNGESGVHKQIMSLVAVMDSWAAKLKSTTGRSEGMQDSDRLKLETALSGLQSATQEVLLNISSTQSESDKSRNATHDPIEVEQVFDTIREFISTQSNYFDCENSRLCDEVGFLHTALTRWLVDLLVLLVPDPRDPQDHPSPPLGPGDPGVRTEVTLDQLEEDAKSLTQRLELFSKYISSSCQLILEQQVQRNSSQDTADNMKYEHNTLQRECSDWMETCGILLSEARAVAMELSVNSQPGPASVADITSPEHSVETLVDLPAEPEPVRESSDEQLTEGEPVVHEEETAKGEEPHPASVMKLIGYDGNITERVLGEHSVPLDGTDHMVVCPTTADGHQGFDALVSMEMLHTQLHDVEMRAQGAEERALRAEEALQAAMVQIKDLERQVKGRVEPKVKKTPTSRPKQPPAPPPPPPTASPPASRRTAPTPAEPKPGSSTRRPKKR